MSKGQRYLKKCVTGFYRTPRPFFCLPVAAEKWEEGIGGHWLMVQLV